MKIHIFFFMKSLSYQLFYINIIYFRIIYQQMLHHNPFTKNDHLQDLELPKGPKGPEEARRRGRHSHLRSKCEVFRVACVYRYISILKKLTITEKRIMGTYSDSQILRFSDSQIFRFPDFQILTE